MSIKPVTIREVVKLMFDQKWKVVKDDEKDFRTMFVALPITELSKLGKITASFFLSIPPGGRVHKHTDTHLNTYHVPIKTNDDAVSYMYEPELNEYHLEVGKVYRVNRQVPHYSVNQGSQDRIHLLVEVA